MVTTKQFLNWCNSGTGEQDLALLKELNQVQARSSLMPSDPGCDKYERVLVETGRKMCPSSQSNSHPDKHFAGLLFEWIFNRKHATCSNKSTFIISSRRALSKIPLALLWVRNNLRRKCWTAATLGWRTQYSRNSCGSRFTARSEAAKILTVLWFFLLVFFLMKKSNIKFMPFHTVIYFRNKRAAKHSR